MSTGALYLLLMLNLGHNHCVRKQSGDLRGILTVQSKFFFYESVQAYLCVIVRYHHDIESYNIKKPLIIEGIDKMKSVVSSYWANYPAEVAGVVNIVSDAINVPNNQQSENIEQVDFTTGTQ
jgi:hypothetical protein